ncbi:tyrosine-protein phosphatase [uncultured Limosilactobacillus sp.]|uniref:tyrosine-protein phosphatase n=1 Tax=uncultured Limosilactobacillus sp. TaxID=2837629 RepID=UPI0025F4F72F|nr:tyrosine-protein phosphatase [uncultured Limosilactobacillus sp.]
MAHQRMIPLLNTHNFRDLGGYPTTNGKTVKWGKIFRSDKLSQLSDTDQNQLLTLNIATDIDLRSKEETTAAPDQLPHQIQYLANPVFQRDVTDSSKSVNKLDEELQQTPQAGRKHMQKVYHDMMGSSHAANAFRVIFEHLLSAPNDQGILFHCTAGKDRTGMSACLILRALEVSPAIAKKDYLLTNTALKNFLNGRQAMLRAAQHSTILIDNYTALWTADPSYLSAARHVIEEQYGGMNNYLHQALQLTDGDLKDLRQQYLQ